MDLRAKGRVGGGRAGLNEDLVEGDVALEQEGRSGSDRAGRGVDKEGEDASRERRRCTDRAGVIRC